MKRHCSKPNPLLLVRGIGIALLSAAIAVQASADEARQGGVVAIGGSATEVVYALGE